MEKKIKFTLVTLFLYLIINSIFASVGQLPGTIPLMFKRPPATDLEYEGEVLYRNEAKILYYDLGIDLSEIQPRNSDVFQYTKDVPILKEAADLIDVSSGDTVKYFSVLKSLSGKFRFTTFKKGEEGKVPFTFLIGKKAHNILLRSAILQKLGYIVPPIKHIKDVKVTFKSKFKKEDFLNSADIYVVGDSRRWIINENEKEIHLRDLIVFNSNDKIYNFALGSIPSNIIRGRRVLNSLLLPFAFADVPESVNLFSWNLGTIISNHIRLEYETARNFFTPYEDALWILKRLRNLRRKDFKEIALYAKLPDEVSLLLTEKLISRRNSILKLFNVDHDKIDFNPKISDGNLLINGKLTKEWWPGYASRFSFGDPESPLSSKEIFAFLKSKFITNIISNAINYFNSKVIPSTDIKNKLFERQIEKVKKSFENYLLNGEVYMPDPVAVYAVPFINGNLIISREVVTGRYLGTDNVVQLADATGFNISLGAYLGTDLVSFPWMLSGNVNAHVTRIYSHLTPIKSIKKALKTPYKNILVPLWKKRLGRILDDAVESEDELSNSKVDIKEHEKKLSKLMENFKKKFKVGESIVITDSIGGGFQVNGGYQFAKHLNAFAGFRNKQAVLSRTHIYRKDVNTIQIYRDSSKNMKLGFNLGINALIPIINFSTDSLLGQAKTKFYQLNIDNNIKYNTDFHKNLIALRALLVDNNIELVRKMDRPYVVNHNYYENPNNFSFLFYKHKRLKSKDLITVNHPSGQKKYFYRHIVGYREGYDYQNTISEVINSLIRELSNLKNIAIHSGGNNNPGVTLYGKAFTRRVVFESEVLNPDKNTYRSKGDLRGSIVRVTHTSRGWKTSKSNVLKMITDMNKKYNFDLYPDNILNETKELELYQIKLFVNFYEKAINRIIKTPKQLIYKVFTDDKYLNNKIFSNSHNSRKDDPEDEKKRMASLFTYYQQKIKKFKRKRDLQKVAVYTAKMISLMEASLNIKGIFKISGSKYIYIYSRLEGFRVGDENGDMPYVSNSIGRIGSKYFMGPLNTIKEKIGMTHSEFFSDWTKDIL